MNRLFRIIRKKLASENNLRKYLLYALGEILLIVFGILIAFQVDEWNNQRKNSKKVQAALHSLHGELTSDSLAIDDQIAKVGDRLSGNYNLLKRITKKSSTIDTLLNIARSELEISWIGHINYSTSTFDNLRSTGTFELLPDSIKFALADYYSTQQYYTNIVELSNNQYRERLHEFIDSYVFKNRAISGYSSSSINRLLWNEVDPKHLAVHLYWMLTTRGVLHINYLQELKIVQERTRSLIRSIKPLLNRP